jgi:4-amino-4-deoxy-L-arabinose transferase-like glycosyltransferase
MMPEERTSMISPSDLVPGTALVAPLNARGAKRPAPEFSQRWSWLILGLIALLYVGTCFTPVIFDDNEGLYAGAVREMHQRGDWLVPMSNGFPRVQKPPLVYWTMLISTSLLGENEFALRLPNALATVGWIVATYLMARRLGGERCGIASALVLASMLGVWVFNHLVQPEPFLACFVSLALWCLIEARLSLVPPGTNGRWYLVLWIFLALGTMSKGLHGALWPLATALLTWILIPGWRPWLRPILSWRGLVAFGLIVVPWYAFMAVRFHGFLQAHFINEQLGASLNTRYPADAKQLPIWQFYLQHLLFWAPWIMLLPASIALLRRNLGEPRSHANTASAASRDIAGMLGVWVAVIMVSVIFSTRQDYYSMCSWGAVAIFLAWPWVDWKSGKVSLSRWYFLVPSLLIALVGAFSLGFADWAGFHPAASGATAPIQNRDTFMDAIGGISPGLWADLLPLLGIFGMSALVAGSMACVLIWWRKVFAAFLVLAGSGAVPVCLAAVGFTIMSPYFSLVENARAINREIAGQPGSVVACEARPNTASSLLYYLNARVHWVNAPFDNQYAQKVLGLGRDYYWDDAALLRVWGSAAPVYLIVEEDRLAHWREELPAGVRVVKESGTRVVLANR